MHTRNTRTRNYPKYIIHFPVNFPFLIFYLPGSNFANFESRELKRSNADCQRGEIGGIQLSASLRTHLTTLTLFCD